MNHPSEVVCTGPKYQYPYASDGTHMLTEGYQLLGEKYGQVYYERVVKGNNWQPLQPISATHSGREITVKLNVPVLPLTWDTTLPAPHQSSLTEWKNGKGFEVRSSSGNITISSVGISGDSVKITCASDLPSSGLVVGYALTTDGAMRTSPQQGSYRWGQLRDSDPFIGDVTKKAQPNYCVSFEMNVQ